MIEMELTISTSEYDFAVLGDSKIHIPNGAIPWHHLLPPPTSLQKTLMQLAQKEKDYNSLSHPF